MLDAQKVGAIAVLESAANSLELSLRSMAFSRSGHV
jgi:hypothetical protein